jgi:hypothetical protein
MCLLKEKEADFVPVIEKTWEVFKQQNPFIAEDTIDDHLEYSIFLKHPFGHSKIKIEENNRLGVLEHNIDFIISRTSLKFITHLEQINEDDQYEAQINLCLVFLYALGAYSPEIKLVLINHLIEKYHFSNQDKIALNEQSNLILSENESFLVNNFNQVINELYSHYDINYPSIISEWKYGYGILSNNSTPLISIESTHKFDLFTNQLNLTDSESYCILLILRGTIIKYIDENYTNLLVG